MHSTPPLAPPTGANRGAPARRAASLLLTALAASSCGGRAPATPAPASDAPRAPAAGAAAAPADGRLLDLATQLVVVTTPGWDSTSGTLHRFARGDARAEWRPVGSAVAVVVGRSGLGWDAGAATRAPAAPGDPRKREGDGRSPAGIFPLDTAFGYAPADSMGWVRLPYVPLDVGTDCVDDTSSVHYNTVVDRNRVPSVDWSSAEHMRSVREYRYGVIVGYNATPPVRGRGSCIFLHVWDGPGSHTAGCTAFAADRVAEMLGWLDPRRHPVLVQLPAAEYERVRESWGLPRVGE